MASFIDNVKVSKTDLGKSTMTSGNAYRITLTHNGKKASFIFNDNYRNASGKEDLIVCLYNDAMAWAYHQCFEDFVWEYGYEIHQLKEAKKAYDECKKQDRRLSRLFSLEEINAIPELLEKWF